MKATALFLAVSLLFEILTPYITLLAQELPEKQTEQIVQANAESRSWRKQVSSRGPALAVAERAIRLFYQMDVALMSRPNMNISLLEKRLYAYAIYTSSGTKSTFTGQISGKYPEGIWIKSAGIIRRKTHIRYAEIDTLVVARDPQALERWQRRMEGRLVVMSRSTLEPSKLEDGWYAYVVHNYETDKRAELAEIVEINERHFVVNSSYGSWGSSGTLKKIRYYDIHFIVGAENRGDIESWRNARQVIKRLTEDPEIRFKAPSIIDKLSERRWTPGRLVDVNQDTFRIAVGPSRRDVYPVPASAVTELEFYSGRRRNTVKGLLFGLAAGTATALVITANVEKEKSQGNKWNSPDTGYEVRQLVPGFLVPVIVFTAIGALIQTDRWVDAPINRLKLSVAPAPKRGVGAALWFKF